MKKAISYIIIFLILLGGTMVFKNIWAKQENSQPMGVTNTISVQVQKAKMVEKTSNITYKANLEPLEEGSISSKVAGKVAEVLFDNGKYVSKGQPLIVLNDQDVRNQLKAAENQLKISQIQLKTSESQLASSQESMKKLEVNLDTCQRNYDRTKALFDQGGVAQSNLEDAESALKAAKNDLESANSNIETLKVGIEASKAAIDSAKINVDTLSNSLGNTVIKAPISGVIDEKNVNLGQYVSPGALLAKVKNISSVYAVIQVEAEQINNIKLGQKAVVKLNDGNKTGFEGIVKNIGVSANPSSRVFDCKIQVENKNGLLHPGVFAAVEMLNNQRNQIIAIPIQTLAGNEGGYYVFVSDNGVARKQSVEIGETTGNMVEIKSGLQKDDNVICTNVSTLQDGDSIIVSK